eukprot:scaffold194265_cov33-Tisochrysis_lutea.AAC.2
MSNSSSVTIGDRRWVRRPLPPPQGIAHSWQPSASRLKDGDDAYRYGQVKPSEIRGAWKPRAMWSGERAPPWVPAGKLYRPSTAKGLPDPVRGGHPWNPVYDNFPEEDVQRGLSNAYTTSTTFWRRQRASEHKHAICAARSAGRRSFLKPILSNMLSAGSHPALHTQRARPGHLWVSIAMFRSRNRDDIRFDVPVLGERRVCSMNAQQNCRCLMPSSTDLQEGWRLVLVVCGHVLVGGTLAACPCTC